MQRILFSILALFLISAPARAQTGVTVATTITAVTIGTSNTFQQALPSQARKGCTIQYTGGNTGFVFFGLAAQATTASSIQLKAQQAVYCEWAGITLTDAVQVSGTAGDTFVINKQ